MPLYIGCSGYYYREWKGEFYPPELPSTRWLQYYAQHFNTIEINSTFYKAPTAKSLAKWHRDTPDDFVFTVKANKLFTHFKKLKEATAELDEFYNIILQALQSKLRCVLFQFPASVRYSPEMLDRVLSLSKYPLTKAIEFRDLSWWQPEIFQALQAAGLTFCNISLPDFPDLPVTTTPAAYLRFHGKPVLYKSAYGEAALEPWANHTIQQYAETTFVYFNNTWFGAAIDDAKTFRTMLTGNQ